VERLSYPIITPSAAVGVLEAIYWKPQFRWEVTEIAVLHHPDRGDIVDWENYMPITLNELSAQGETHPEEGYNLDEHRVQRTCMILRWPCYRIRAWARILSNSTNPAAVKRQFDDRVVDGQCFWQPFLGLREFVANFGLPRSEQTGKDVPISSVDEPDLGMIMHSVVVPPGSKVASYRFVPLTVRAGVFKPNLGGLR